jgi:hypothetical protein
MNAVKNNIPKLVDWQQIYFILGQPCNLSHHEKYRKENNNHVRGNMASIAL